MLRGCWLPKKFLETSDFNPAIDSPGDWLGKWHGTNSEITFSKGNRPSQLLLNGNANWAGNGEGNGEGNVNVGNLEHVVVNLNNAGASYVSDICQIYFKLFKIFNRESLLAIDNGECGGLNVTFSGFYTKNKSKK